MATDTLLKLLDQEGLKSSLFTPLLENPTLPKLDDFSRNGLEESLYSRVQRDHPHLYPSLPDSDVTLDLQQLKMEGQTYYIPKWWPTVLEGNTLNPRQRLTWFQMSVREILQSDFDQLSNLKEKQLRLLTTLLILHTEHETESLPTPDLL